MPTYVFSVQDETAERPATIARLVILSFFFFFFALPPTSFDLPFAYALGIPGS